MNEIRGTDVRKLATWGEWHYLEPNTPCKYVYHKDIGFPETIIIPDQLWHVGYTTHARERINQRIGGLKIAPKILRLTKENIVEIQTDDNITIKKALIRIKYTKNRHMILVIEVRPGLRKLVVITLFYNKKNDHHSTLDKTKYNKPNNQ